MYSKHTLIQGDDFTGNVNFTCEGWASVIFGDVNLAVEPWNKELQSVYADPMPNPAPKAIDAQRVTGLPSC